MHQSARWRAVGSLWFHPPSIAYVLETLRTVSNKITDVFPIELHIQASETVLKDSRICSKDMVACAVSLLITIVNESDSSTGGIAADILSKQGDSYPHFNQSQGH